MTSRPHRRIAIPALGALTLASAIALSACASPATPASTPAPSAVESASPAATPAPTPSSEPSAAAAPAYGAVGALAQDSFTEADMLRFAAEDEYLAHGEYTLAIEAFGSKPPYPSILRSEATHLDLLRGLYAARGLEFPEDTSAPYLTAPESLLASAQHGVQAEIDNIAMYDRFLEEDLDADMASVFTTLRDASVNHLNAFEAQVQRLS